MSLSQQQLPALSQCMTHYNKGVEVAVNRQILNQIQMIVSEVRTILLRHTRRHNCYFSETKILSMSLSSTIPSELKQISLATRELSVAGTRLPKNSSRPGLVTHSRAFQ